MMEVLQILKFNHRNRVLDFSSVFIDDPSDLGAVLPEEMSDSELMDDIRYA